MSPQRLVVVGGGLAGISAALSAADSGAEVTLLERRGKLGGLTWSFKRKGRWFDNGQHVFMRCCTAYRDFIDRIGASSQVFLQPRLEVPVLAPGGVMSTISRDRLPAPAHLVASLARYRHLSGGERLRLGGAVMALRRLDLADPTLDSITFGKWLSEHGQSQRAIEHLWDLITVPTLNVGSAEASLLLAVKVFRTGLVDCSDGADIGWAKVPLGELHGDNSMRALQAVGVEVILGASVRSVHDSLDGPVVNMDDRQVRADCVIVATPPEVAQSILTPGALPLVENLGTSPIVNVHLVLDRKVTDLPFAACVDSPVQFFFDRTSSSGRLVEGEGRFAKEEDSEESGTDHWPGAEEGVQVLSISLSAADAYIGRRPEQLVSMFFDSLGEVLPAVRNARLIDGVVSRERAATFKASAGTAKYRPGPKTGAAGVFAAGAWCDTGWPATMEGAVRSGLAAATMALGSSSVHPSGAGLTFKAANSHPSATLLSEVRA